MAEQYGVSRKFLYLQAKKAKEAILAALLPGEAGRKTETAVITVDDLFVWRTIGVGLSVIPCTVRTIQSPHSAPKIMRFGYLFEHYFGHHSVCQ